MSPNLHEEHIRALQVEIARIDKSLNMDATLNEFKREHLEKKQVTLRNELNRLLRTCKELK